MEDPLIPLVHYDGPMGFIDIAVAFLVLLEALGYLVFKTALLLHPKGRTQNEHFQLVMAFTSARLEVETYSPLWDIGNRYIPSSPSLVLSLLDGISPSSISCKLFWLGYKISLKIAQQPNISTNLRRTTNGAPA